MCEDRDLFIRILAVRSDGFTRTGSAPVFARLAADSIIRTPQVFTYIKLICLVFLGIPAGFPMKMTISERFHALLVSKQYHVLIYLLLP